MELHQEKVRKILLTGEPTLRRMLIRFALVIGLLLVSTQLALLFHLNNTLGLLALASIPAGALLVTEVVMTRKAAHETTFELGDRKFVVKSMSEAVYKDLPEPSSESSKQTNETVSEDLPGTFLMPGGLLKVGDLSEHLKRVRESFYELRRDAAKHQATLDRLSDKQVRDAVNRLSEKQRQQIRNSLLSARNTLGLQTLPPGTPNEVHDLIRQLDIVLAQWK
jgi:hypothetical protein